MIQQAGTKMMALVDCASDVLDDLHVVHYLIFPSHCQLVYDVQDGGGCFHLIAVNVSSEELEKYRVMGSKPPPAQ